MIEIGGPVYPVQDMSKWLWSEMSLRDYYIGQALVGLLSTINLCDHDIEQITKHAINQADELIKSLAKG